MKKKIFITGSSGFIGFHLSKYFLNKKFDVLGFDNLSNYYDKKIKINRQKILLKYKNFKVINSNLENKKILNQTLLKYKPSIVFHLAAQAGVRYSFENPKAYIDSNIVGTFNLLEIIKNINIKHFLFSSTSSVYGANKTLPFNEYHNTDSQLSIYAATKKANESLIFSYAYGYKIPSTVMRFFTVYGPYGRPDLAIYKFCKKILNNEPIEVYNKGNMYRDFTYVDDLVSCMFDLTKYPPIKKYSKLDTKHFIAPYRVLNMGNSNKVKLSKMIKLIEKYLNQKAKIKYLPMQKGDVVSTDSDSSSLNSIIGMKPSTNIEQGLNSFIEWYKKSY